MGIRAKFNLVLLLVAAIGIGLVWTISTSFLRGVATQEVLQNSRIMMESAAGARKYTSEEIAPLLIKTMAVDFHPQAVSAFAAKRSFDVLHGLHPDFSYREAALNPTNPEDRAVDWEADIINDFRSHPTKIEAIARRDTPAGPMLTLARPLVSRQNCLECHSTPGVAPQSMVAIYGAENGFGWKKDEIIGAQLVSVPMSVALARADRVRALFVLPFAVTFVLLFMLLNLLLHFTVLGPIDKIATTAEAVSLGEMTTPEYIRGGSDQIARLSASFNRMRRSLQEAMRLLGDP